VSGSVRIAVTTIVRGSSLEVPSGYLRVMDLEAGTELARAPVPDALHRALDDNPRGGLRGGRGLAVAGDRLAMAINDRILVLDRGWRLVRVLSHPWMGGVHDLAADPDGIWVTCADNDLVLRIGWDGELRRAWHWRADAAFREALGHGWLPGFERDVDNRDPFAGGLRLELGHVNAIAPDGDRVLVGLGLVRPPVPLGRPIARALTYRAIRRMGLERAARAAVVRWAASPIRRELQRRLARRAARSVTPGGLNFAAGPQERPGWTWAIAELGPDGARIAARHPVRGLPVHNLALDTGRLVVNDSPQARVVAVDRSSGAIVRSVGLPGEFPYPRGLARLPDGCFVVGTQRPAAVHLVDLDAGRVMRTIELPDNQGESPYAIVVLPESFEEPSGRLPLTRAGWGIAGGDASGA